MEQVEATPTEERRTRSYELSSLTWSSDHCSNAENKYCYCGDGFEKDDVNLYCEGCRTWYHRKCLPSDDITNQLLPGQGNYEFWCAVCKPKAQFALCDASYRAGGLMAMVYLQHTHPDRSFPAQEVISFIEKHWKLLLPYKSHAKSWETNTLTGLSRTDEICDIEGPASKGIYKFKKAVDLREWPPSRFRPRTSGANPRVKRRTTADPSGEPPARRKKESLADAHCFLRDKYRYTSAEADPFHLNQWRVITFDKTVSLSSRDKAEHLNISPDGRTVTGYKGYSSVRATHGVGHGVWYWEATVLPSIKADPGHPDGHVRIGWGHAACDLQVPCGFDSLSYAWRDIKGTVFHKSKGRDFGPPEGYKVGDVLGFLIELPDKASTETLPPSMAKAAAVGLQKQAYLEEERVSTSQGMSRAIGSRMTCFKNGQRVGVLAEALPTCRWYPMVSLYYGAHVEVNFGPSFKHPPALPHRPVSEAGPLYNAEVALVDILDKVVGRLHPSTTTSVGGPL
eukprot:m.97880 g.97880  ORF g.97880 m.97880 type:complete len:509 (+) comp15062_c2_seq7:53-1579(+)